MKLKLNPDTILETCSPDTPGAMCAASFDAQDEWVIVKDQGPRYATRYTYSTQYARDQKLYFECGNAKAAIQQALIDALKKKIRLRDTYFKIIKQ